MNNNFILSYNWSKNKSLCSGALSKNKLTESWRLGATKVHPVNTWLHRSAIAHEWPRLCHVVVPVSVRSRSTHAQLSPRRLSKDDTGVIQVHGVGTDPGAWGTSVTRHRAQGEFQTRRGGGSGRGRGQDGSMDGPGGGGDVDLWLMGLVLVGGQEPQCSESCRVVLAWEGGG